MVRCRNVLAEAGLQTRLILQIHDELLFEGPADEAERARELVCAEMSAAWELDPPLASMRASGRTGWRPSRRGPRVGRPVDGVHGRSDRAPGTHQFVLGKAVGTWQAALVSFAIGTVLLAGSSPSRRAASARSARRATSAGTT